MGAGQAGLSTAYHLSRLGLRTDRDVMILDRGPGTGGAWQHRWESLRLGTAHRVHDLPGMAALGLSFDTADRGAPAREVVADYYRRYENAYDLRVRRPVAVTAVRSEGTDLVVESSAGRFRAAAVVNATGTWGAPYVPFYPGAPEFPGTQAHTADYVSASAYAGKRVLVVGGGSSAIGFLLELEGVAARTLWSTRRPVSFSEQTDLDLESAVRAVAQQDAAARAGKVLPSIVSGTGIPKTRRVRDAIDRGLLESRGRIARFEGNSVVWASGGVGGGDTDEIDAILWATGFRPEVRHLAALGLRESTGGISVVDGVAERDPRVFFAGYGPQASTIGANRAGRLLARRVHALVGSPPTPNGG
nr:NAD(P)-binding domain-containing protein [Planctomonas psychrotolerans]